MISLICVCMLGVLPLTIFGGMIETNQAKEASNEIERFSKASRAWPTLEYYKSSISMILLAGLFPFSALHFELYYMFTAIWARKIYTMYSSLLIVFILTMSISAIVSIVFTYLQLHKRDFRWWWKSFLYGGSCGLYVFLYAIYYYVAKSHMTGFIQLLYYFSYSAIFALIGFLVYGTIGFIGTSAFVKHIYERHKVD